LPVAVEGAKTALADLYEGVTEVTGEVMTSTDEDNGRKYFVNALDQDEDGETRMRPFRCFLDVGIQRTSKGCPIFGALKGAVDGGLDIPHNEKLFPGYTNEDGEINYDAEEHAAKILGSNLAEYMEELKDEDEDKYNSLFATYIKQGITEDNLVDTIKACHEAIRKDPSPKHAESAKTRSAAGHPNRAKSLADFPAQRKTKRLTYEARKARVAEKKEKIMAFYEAQMAGEESDVEDDE
jgi:large subunit ribosomal protein L5e